MVSNDESLGFGTALALEYTPKGWATRARLVDAAGQVFAETGFIHCRVTDITKRANAAAGTFYQYFDSKEDVFKAVMDDVIADFLKVLRTDQPADASPFEVIDHDNRQYVVAYRKHAAIMRVFEQVATFDEEFATMRRAIRERFIERAARTIERWQDLGICEPQYSARIQAALLVAMVDNFAYTWLSLGYSYPDGDIADAMTHAWVGALGLSGDDA